MLVYSLDADEPVRRERARRILSDPIRDEFVVSTQVLQELYSTLTTKLRTRYGSHDAELAVRHFLRIEVVTVSPAILLEGIAASRRWQLSFWDALIVASARAARCSVLLTEDLQAGRDFDGLHVVNPFEGPEPVQVDPA